MPDQELQLKLKEHFSLEKTHYNQLVIDAQKKMKTRVIHDLRVSLQKLCLFYELTSLFYKEKKRERILRKKKKLLKIKKRMSRLRDSQVQQKIFQEFFSTSSTVKKFFKKKQKREEKKIQPYLGTMKFSLPSIYSDETFLPQLGRFYSSQLFDVQKKLASLKMNCTPDTLHELRKSLKRLMYLTEIFNNLGLETKMSYLFLKEFQKKLGQVQDASMTIQTLTEFLQDCPHHLRQAVVDYRLQNQLIQKELIPKTFSELERSPLWPN
jgi:CHAD domain-containing protein